MKAFRNTTKHDPEEDMNTMYRNLVDEEGDLMFDDDSTTDRTNTTTDVEDQKDDENDDLKRPLVTTPAVIVKAVPVRTYGRGSFFSFPCLCKCMLITTMVFVVLGSIASIGAYFWMKDIVLHLTVEEPHEPFPVVDMTDAEVEVLKDRVKLFVDQLMVHHKDKKKGPLGDLVITQDEINGLIGHSDYLRGNMQVLLEDNKITEQYSLPVDMLPGGKGRYFVGEDYTKLVQVDDEQRVEFEMETAAKHLDWFKGPLVFAQLQYLVNEETSEDNNNNNNKGRRLHGHHRDHYDYHSRHRDHHHGPHHHGHGHDHHHYHHDDYHRPKDLHLLELYIRKGRFFGKDVPQDFIDQHVNLLDDFYDDPDNFDALLVMDGIESVSVMDGKIVVHPRTAPTTKSDQDGAVSYSDSNEDVKVEVLAMAEPVDTLEEEEGHDNVNNEDDEDLTVTTTAYDSKDTVKESTLQKKDDVAVEEESYTFAKKINGNVRGYSGKKLGHYHNSHSHDHRPPPSRPLVVQFIDITITVTITTSLIFIFYFLFLSLFHPYPKDGHRHPLKHGSSSSDSNSSSSSSDSSDDYSF